MAVGKRIRFFRNRKGMTQKQFGETLGFMGKTSDVRIAQYETEARVPKSALLKKMAAFFDVSSHALNIPDIDSYIGLMHTFFALEDMYGLKIGEKDGQPCLYLDRSISAPGSSLDSSFRAWQEQASKLENGEITREQYDEWRYKYPELDAFERRAAAPLQKENDTAPGGHAESPKEKVQEISKEEKKMRKQKK